ncbi:hypothetical protein GGTG_04326 [Gaeumannomyces tritici R3-111a-1]|uniref:Uncharacterized protein n=1 Tax=Gaeumannomyces tritici (strain R3-111a-1) TaxID=644352 RepID=J3NSS7_GAET3|nr:hypothetical protein GGTG_04326 [Gaeumannomyces tritici R3-111a-1]EJT79240.1 hypothetical protein GGTG_04326 [Gaeumannomyces tritici R3-111a-1]
MSQLLKGKSKAQNTSPALFLHSSPAGSNVSLTAAGAGLSPPQGHSSVQRNSSLRHHHEHAASPAGGAQTSNGGGGGGGAPTAFRSAGLGGISLPLKLRQESTRATDRTDALWAEMQATLEEVELSASGGTRVFGPDHDHKLAGLRAAQIALAQAWARSEADEAIETTLSTDGAAAAGGGAATATAAAAAGANKDSVGGAGDAQTGKTEGAAGAGSTGSAARPGSPGGRGSERLGAKMEEETEVDILLARKRREANDRYFHRVNQGVLDVVARLDEVAVAMRAVEQESKDIWGEGEHYQEHESVAGSTKT